MGMPGMSVDACIKYASTANEKKAATVHCCHEMTVAEWRNAANPTTKYYDTWSIDSFVQDASIPPKTKIEVLCGKLFAEMQDEAAWKKVFEKLEKTGV